MFQPSLCHVFVFVPDAAAAVPGLAESFRREHPGQGTANVCYCFDDSYLELLRVTDAEALRSPAIAPTRLFERATNAVAGACPFGIAVRGPLPAGMEAWEWRPPYLPPGLSIAVAALSSDPRQPFVFRSPGDVRPDAWTDGRAGARQTAAGLTEVVGVRLRFPDGVDPHPDLRALAAAGLLALDAGAPAWELHLRVAAVDGRPRELVLPALAWRG